MNNFKDSIINKIKAGDISMRPKWHFVLSTFLLLAGVVLASLVAVYLLSFVLFTMRKSGLLFAPQFGWHGIMMFVVSSPWLLIGMLGIFLLILYVLVSKYSFSYQKPLVYSIIGVVLFVIAMSSFIQYVGMHDRIQAFSEKRNVPGLTPLYKNQTDSKPEGMVVVLIMEINEGGFILKTTQGDVSVAINDRTRMSPNISLVVGEEVMVFGNRKEGMVEAFGVRSGAGVKGVDRVHNPPERITEGEGRLSRPPQ